MYIFLKSQLSVALSVIFFLLLCGLLRPAVGSASYPDYPDMQMNATPNPVGPGAKAMGMGGAFISVADDATAASWNPGGLLQVLRPELSLVGSWFSGRFDYNTSGIENVDINGNPLDIQHLNYGSFVLPRVIFKRELSSPTAAQPTFSAPDVGPGGEALSFQLTVTDNGGLSSTDTNSTPKEEGRLSKKEQQKRATEVFHQIFKLSRNNKKRAGNLEQMIALYTQIITHYPDVPLAQESYWRLIEMFFRDFNPPKKDQALTLYKEYGNRYPDSPLRRAVKGTMTRLLYLNKYWNELLVFTSVCAEDFDDPKRLKSPLPLFYYSEAKLHLNDFKESSRGYEVIVNYFPDSRMARTAKKRMAEIKGKKNKSN